MLKDKIKIDKNFITDLITKSWEESEGIQQQINSIEADSAMAAKTIKLLKDLLTSYYVFIGCLEGIENEPVATAMPIEPVNTTSPAEEAEIIPKEPTEVITPKLSLPELSKAEIEPFEYFVDFDEPVGKPLTDADLYN